MLSVIIFVSVLGFVMILVIIISITYKLMTQRQDQRHTMELPLQVLGLKDENVAPVLVILGKQSHICEKTKILRIIEMDRTLQREERCI